MPRSPGRLLLLAVLLAASLGACRPRQTPTPTPVSTPSPKPVGTPQVATPNLFQNAALIYRREGGVVAFCDLLTISPAGLATYIAECRGLSQSQQLPPDQVAELQYLTTQVATFELHSEDNPARPENLRRDLYFMGSGSTAPQPEQAQLLAFADQILAQFALTSAGTPVPTAQPVLTYGQVEDFLTHIPVPNASLIAGYNATYSDADGKFRIASFVDDPIVINAQEYETGNAQPQSVRPVIVHLVPDPRATLAHIYSFLRSHAYARAYYVLHPDVQALFTRDDFIHYKERTVDYEITSVSLGPITWLSSWQYRGRTYTDVAEIPAYVVVRRGGQQVTETRLEHLARADGFWRWFQPPLSAAATPAPPSATGCQTAIYPIGTTVEVCGTTLLNMRTGPGTQYGIVTTLPFGEPLIIRSAPVCVGDPSWWYEVEQLETGVNGWVVKHYICPLGSVPGVTVTPVPGVPPPALSPGTTVVGPDDLALHTAPGDDTPVISRVEGGVGLTVRSEPFYVNGVPWYVLEPPGRGLFGWASGALLTPVPGAAAGAARAAPAPTAPPAAATVIPIVPYVTTVPRAVRTAVAPIITAVVPPLATLVIPPVSTAILPLVATAVAPPVRPPAIPPLVTPVVPPLATAVPPGGGATGAGGYAPGTRLVVVSPVAVSLYASPGVNNPVIATVAPSSTLIVRRGPSLADGVAWYFVRESQTGVVGWINAGLVRPASGGPP